jgi:hypothetical protein
LEALVTAEPLGPPSGTGLPGEPPRAEGAGMVGAEEPWWVPGDREPSDAELCGAWPDPFAGPPDLQSWQRYRDEADTEDEPQEGDSPAACFAGGGPAEVMTPDPVLAALSRDALDAGLGRLDDDELVGLLRAARRLASWQAGAAGQPRPHVDV